MHHKPRHSKHHTATHHDAVDERVAGSTTHRWLLPVLLVAQLMVILDITAVNIALPHIAMDLHMSGSTISWTITSYSLIFGSLLLFGGRAADLLQASHILEFLVDRQDVHGHAPFVQARIRLPDKAQAVDVEIIGLQELRQVVIDFRVDQHCADDSFFGLAAVRLTGSGFIFVGGFGR